MLPSPTFPTTKFSRIKRIAAAERLFRSGMTQGTLQHAIACSYAYGRGRDASDAMSGLADSFRKIAFQEPAVSGAAPFVATPSAEPD